MKVKVDNRLSEVVFTLFESKLEVVLDFRDKVKALFCLSAFESNR